jgi:hypothetical protein
MAGPRDLFHRYLVTVSPIVTLLSIVSREGPNANIDRGTVSASAAGVVHRV